MEHRQAFAASAEALPQTIQDVAFRTTRSPLCSHWTTRMIFMHLRMFVLFCLMHITGKLVLRNIAWWRFLIAVSMLCVGSPSSDVFPRCTKSTICACNETFFLLFDDVALTVAFAEVRGLEQQQHESNEKDT